MRMKGMIIVLAAVLLAWLPFASAEESVEELKNQIQELQKRVDELEAAGSTTTRPGPALPRNSYQWDPFAEMDRIQEEMNRLFRDSFSRRQVLDPGMFQGPVMSDRDFELEETQDGYIIKFDVSNVDQEKMDIKINPHSITVKGEYSAMKKEENEQGFYSSRSYGTFLKTIPLPIDADTSKVETQKQDNLLIIKIPKV